MEQYHEFTYRSADGLKLFCREYLPDTPSRTVLCLPGLTRNSRDFEPLARHLAMRYRVLTPDLRGRGLSEWDTDPSHYAPGTYYADVLQLVTEQIADPVAIIGTSLGGMLAMALAATVAPRIAGIVLNDIGPEVAAAGLERISSYVGRGTELHSWAEAAAEAQRNYAAAYPDLNDEGWLWFARASYRQRDDGVIVADYDPRISAALRAGNTQPPDMWKLWESLAAVPVPVLVLRGEMSDVLSAKTLQGMHERKGDLQSVTVPGRGHAPLLDEPPVVPALDAFLQQVLTSAR
jgi:pimeloyl-ACP methyl ester carboxylesterase